MFGEKEQKRGVGFFDQQLQKVPGHKIPVSAPSPPFFPVSPFPSSFPLPIPSSRFEAREEFLSWQRGKGEEKRTKEEEEACEKGIWRREEGEKGGSKISLLRQGISQI